ncbi:MAG: hypothetical protein KAW52_01300 [candidate division Zixibacteria bacterium]|nr:hypothetical protein [candidate division Zixibacteria bacterium]
MTSQIEVGNGQLTFAHPFCIPFTPPVIPPVVALQPIKKKHSTHQKSTSTEILVKQERILRLQKEIEDSEDEAQNQGKVEEDFDPEGEEEDLFDVVVLAMDSDLYGLRTENEIEIKLLEEEIRKLERKCAK